MRELYFPFRRRLSRSRAIEVGDLIRFGDIQLRLGSYEAPPLGALLEIIDGGMKSKP